MSDSFRLTRVGTVRSTRRDVVDDDWDKETTRIELDASFPTDALKGLEDFSHVEILFVMDQVDPSKIVSGARHPRNNPDWPAVGIFAQRAKNRPNAIGATVCRVLGVDGRVLRVHGLDAVDGSPVIDIKPWVKEFAPRGDLSQPAWITELMKNYWA